MIYYNKKFIYIYIYIYIYKTACHFRWPWVIFADTREYGKNSMEFHGTFDLDKVPWNSMELEVRLLKLHGIPWNHRCCWNVVWKVPCIRIWRNIRKISFQCPLKLILIKKLWNFLQSSMEFCPDPKFHWIPWNFFHTPSSMEFLGIPWNC